MNLGAITFDDIFDSLPDARAEIRVGVHVYDTVLCTNVDFTRELTGQGMVSASTVTARLKLEDEIPGYQLTTDKVIEINHLASGQWIKFRIAARRDIAGIITLSLETPYE
jgi:hypothetical protein